MTGTFQDTIIQKNILKQDTLKQLSEASKKKYIPNDSVHIRANDSKIYQENLNVSDSPGVCNRNSIANITFYDTNNVITQIDKILTDRFPFTFIELNQHLQEEKKTIMMKHLKDGQEIPASVFHNDWIISIILISAFLYAVIRTFSGNMFQKLVKFVLFLGINETVPRDLGGLYYWQSTLLNLASFLNISVFVYFAALYFGLRTDGIRGVYFWIFSLGIIIAGLTIRHLLCIITGNISEEKEAFREYLLGVYQSYRLAGFISFILVILISYTVILPEKIYFFAGFYTIAIVYFIRILRLFLIFINRHISIFYLILYLCALEILPVVILLKYFTGLV